MHPHFYLLWHVVGTFRGCHGPPVLRCPAQGPRGSPPRKSTGCKGVPLLSAAGDPRRSLPAIILPGRQGQHPEAASPELPPATASAASSCRRCCCCCLEGDFSVSSGELECLRGRERESARGAGGGWPGVAWRGESCEGGGREARGQASGGRGPRLRQRGHLCSAPCRPAFPQKGRLLRARSGCV